MVEILPPSAQITVAVLAPEVSGGAALLVPRVNIEVRGRIPSIDAWEGEVVTVAPPPVEIYITPEVPSIQTGVNIEPPSLDILLSGVSPVIGTGTTNVIDSALSINLTFPVPAIQLGSLVEVPACNIAVAFPSPGNLPTSLVIPTRGQHFRGSIRSKSVQARLKSSTRTYNVT